MRHRNITYAVNRHSPEFGSKGRMLAVAAAFVLALGLTACDGGSERAQEGQPGSPGQTQEQPQERGGSGMQGEQQGQGQQPGGAQPEGNGQQMQGGAGEEGRVAPEEVEP